MANDVEKKSKKEKKHFFKDFKAELKKVIWPTPKQVVNNTVAVITIVLITAVIVFALDLVFKAINTYGINSVRNLVKNDTTTETTTDSDSSDLTSELKIDLPEDTESDATVEAVPAVEEQTTESTESAE